MRLIASHPPIYHTWPRDPFGKNNSGKGGSRERMGMHLPPASVAGWLTVTIAYSELLLREIANNIGYNICQNIQISGDSPQHH